MRQLLLLLGQRREERRYSVGYETSKEKENETEVVTHDKFTR